MESEGLIARLPQFVRENLLVFLLGCIGLVFLGYGLIGFLGQKPVEEEIVIEQSSDKEESLSKVTVDVSGAVEKPGIYILPADSRVNDAVLMAGGLSEQADHTGISRTINFAKRLTDGEKIYIPEIGEETNSAVLTSQTGKTSINTATSTQLEDLPGIGPVTAEKIINSRPYSSTDELLTKKVVGSSVFEKIKDQISL